MREYKITYRATKKNWMTSEKTIKAATEQMALYFLGNVYEVYKIEEL